MSRILIRTALVAPRVDICRRFGISIPALQASDPIQGLFLEKVREYKSKSKGGKLVDPTPEIERELKTELDRVIKQYGGGQGTDMTKFPEIKFEEPKIDPISQTN